MWPTPRLLIGDINSSPFSGFSDPRPAYAVLTAFFGMTDTWDVRHAPTTDPGYTCCHDEDLSDPLIDHDERIDVIFTSEAVSEAKANVMGGEATDRIGGLWPSDHCTVVGEMTH